MISKFRLSILFIIVTSAVVAPTQLGGGDKLDHVRENRPRQPNILFLFPDQWRFDWDGGNDHGTDILPLDLPNVKFIKSQGVRFTHAYVPSPLCAPGRASLASGREYDYCGVLTNTQNDYDISIPTFYSLLRDVGGYHTMTTGKDDLTKASQLGTKDGFGGNWTGTYHQRELGFSDGLRSSGKTDTVAKRQPHGLYGHWLAEQVVTLENGTKISGWDAHYWCIKGYDNCTKDMYPDFLYEDNWVAENAITLLRRKPPDKSWFLQVSFPGPHPPFLVTSNMSESINGRSFPPPGDNPSPPPNTKNRCNMNRDPTRSNTDRCAYGAEIENIDRLFGLILKELQIIGEYNNTVVCISSDHGEMLQDHGDIGKCVPWEGSVSVPLVCMGGPIVKGKAIHQPVSTMDLAGTFLDFAGVSPHPGMTSVSLRQFLTNRDDVPNALTYRPTVSSGLQLLSEDNYFTRSELLGRARQAIEKPHPEFSWRMAVEVETGFKFICCKGTCPGAPSTVVPSSNEYMELLYDVTADPFDMQPLSGTDEYTSAMDRLRLQLPKTPDFDCSKIQRNGIAKGQ